MQIIKKSLKNLGYILTDSPIICSPSQLNIPQLRERVIILGIHSKYLKDTDTLNIYNDLDKKVNINIFNNKILDNNTDNSYNISEYEERVLSTWDEFIKNINRKVLGFPIWSDVFYQKIDTSDFPEWKKTFIKKNKELYNDNKDFIDRWLIKNNYLKDFKPTDRKFEWQAGNNINSVWDGIIQFRPSGVRVKKPDSFPALVAIVQIPIVGKLKRRITPKEASRLQSFNNNFKCHANDRIAYKQFGNAVNVEVIKYFAEKLFYYCENKGCE